MLRSLCPRPPYYQEAGLGLKTQVFCCTELSPLGVERMLMTVTVDWTVGSFYSCVAVSPARAAPYPACSQLPKSYSGHVKAPPSSHPQGPQYLLLSRSAPPSPPFCEPLLQPLHPLGSSERRGVRGSLTSESGSPFFKASPSEAGLGKGPLMKEVQAFWGWRSPSTESLIATGEALPWWWGNVLGLALGSRQPP